MVDNGKMSRWPAAVFFALAGVCAQGADYEILIKNARVADGTGNPWFRGDIGIRAGKIAAVGRIEGSADRTIEAANRVAAPGFIDVHTHIEGAIEKVPRADNFLRDGVTTVVTGNCGGSTVKVGEWLSSIEAAGLGINVATLIGHNSVRAEVMGRANRKATEEEIAAMRAVVDGAMREGAVGFSTGLIYIPGAYSDTAEVVALAGAAAAHGGVYASHMRDEGANIREAIDEAVEVGRVNKMPVQISHFKIDNRKLWGGSSESLALIEKYRRLGVDVVVDQYPYDHSSTNLGITLPNWALADGQEAILERLRTPETRARIHREMAESLAERGQPDYSYAIVAGFEKDRSIEGKTITAINAARGRARTVDNEIETILELMEAGRPSMVYHSMSMEDVERIMRYRNTTVASDGGVLEFGIGMPHPRSYGTNARVLAEFVRNRGTLTLEDAIRRMTSLPARTFGLKGRGQIREGFAADVVLFDPGRVGDRATYEKPHQYTEGFDVVVVNGAMAIDEGKWTATAGGRAIRGNKQ